MEICLSLVLSGRATTDYTNNAVENVFKIATAQTDTALELIKEDDKFLIELVKKLWKLEDTGIHVQQDSIIKSFENSIEYKDNRYSVNLTWEAEYKNTPDNFLPARNRLLSLLKRLSKVPEQLKRYNTIIKDQERDGIKESVESRNHKTRKSTLYPT